VNPSVPKYSVKIDGVTYQAKSGRNLWIKVVEGIGPLKILGTYRGYLLRTNLSPEDNKRYFTQIVDGKNNLYLYTNMSLGSIWGSIEKVASSLKLKMEKE
jgi:hypothetical protein